mmetsp:Transcript_146442/g.407965  ORF Transcript_146442/g.407965 Transcript_146442/m.407965 type:complete len:364 (-) Transcript_146442:107-1198(-)
MAMANPSVISADGCLSWFLGVEEPQLLANDTRSRLFTGEALVHATAGRLWPVGVFSCPSIAELRERAAAMSAGEAPAPEACLTVHDGVDIGRLQATLKTEDRAMVQIASNFNCLENPSRSCAPDYGFLVEGYATDATQGPAASFGVPAASLLRAHFAFHDAGAPPQHWGQTTDRQVELLRDVRHHFGVCVNGKLTLGGNEEPLAPTDVDRVAERIRIGLHTDAEVVFGRSGRRQLEVLQEPFQVVDQVLSASVNWNSPGVMPPQNQLESLTRATLRASYDGAYLAAIIRGRRLLLLTLVGGGSFCNPVPMILEELAAAHARWASHPASKLEEARLCLYPRNEKKATFKALQELVAAAKRRGGM